MQIQTKKEDPLNIEREFLLLHCQTRNNQSQYFVAADEIDIEHKWGVGIVDTQLQSDKLGWMVDKNSYWHSNCQQLWETV